MSHKMSQGEFLQKMAERERELREEASKEFFSEGGFWSFCKWWDDSFFFDEKEPLARLAQILEDMLLWDKYKRLIISVFPRFGKSYIVTCLVAWLYAMDTGKFGTASQVMRNSYDEDMAKKFSRDTLSIITSKKYTAKFPHVKMSKRAKELLSWSLEGSSEYSYTGAGLESGITGKGVRDLRILDDPHKGYESVVSEVKSEKAWQSYVATHLTRDDHSSNCKDIIIGTRWGQSDIIGREIETRPDEWTMFAFPLLDENEKSICEAMCSTKRALDIRRLYSKSGQYHIFSAAYNSEPIESKDMLFLRDNLQKFRMHEIMNREKQQDVTERFMFVDFANKGTDYLSAPICVQIGGLIYVVDWIYTQKQASDTKQMIVDAIRKYGIMRCRIESNTGGDQFADDIEEELENHPVVIEQEHTSSNKETRIIVHAPAIKTRFRFLVEAERSEEYETAMRHLEKYNKKKGRKQIDDAPDSLTGANIMVNDGFGEVELFNY